jgi:lipid II:glycine glycyltransferase (peptidoglycan interpeptide bridge formation enzyme)
LLEEGENAGRGTGDGQSPVAVWLATHESDVLAGIITIFISGQAVYLYGASSDLKRNLMPAYALQWAAIRAAKASGCAEYDFFGIPPGEDLGHAMAGLYLFKTGFGGRIVHRLGSVDLPVQPWAAAAFTSLERIRLFWHKKVMKRIAALFRTMRQKG